MCVCYLKNKNKKKLFSNQKSCQEDKKFFFFKSLFPTYSKKKKSLEKLLFPTYGMIKKKKKKVSPDCFMKVTLKYASHL